MARLPGFAGHTKMSDRSVTGLAEAKQLLRDPLPRPGAATACGQRRLWDCCNGSANSTTAAMSLSFAVPLSVARDFPVRQLAGLCHAEEFQTVKGLGVFELGLHEVVDLGLGLPGLLSDGGLHALTGTGGVITALFDLRRFVPHPFQQLQQLCVLLLAGEGRSLLGRRSGRLAPARGLPPACRRGGLVLPLHRWERQPLRLVGLPRRRVRSE